MWTEEWGESEVWLSEVNGLPMLSWPLGEIWCRSQIAGNCRILPAQLAVFAMHMLKMMISKLRVISWVLKLKAVLKATITWPDQMLLVIFVLDYHKLHDHLTDKL